MTTHWLYIGERLITSVRLPETASEFEVKGKAISQAREVPNIHSFDNLTPKEFECLVLDSKVRKFNT